MLLLTLPFFVVVTVVVDDVVVDTYEMIKIVKFDIDLIAQLSKIKF